jgi:hypothetical protein
MNVAMLDRQYVVSSFADQKLTSILAIGHMVHVDNDRRRTHIACDAHVPAFLFVLELGDARCHALPISTKPTSSLSDECRSSRSAAEHFRCCLSAVLVHHTRTMNHCDSPATISTLRELPVISTGHEVSQIYEHSARNRGTNNEATAFDADDVRLSLLAAPRIRRRTARLLSNSTKCVADPITTLAQNG